MHITSFFKTSVGIWSSPTILSKLGKGIAISGSIGLALISTNVLATLYQNSGVTLTCSDSGTCGGYTYKDSLRIEQGGGTEKRLFWHLNVPAGVDAGARTALTIGETCPDGSSVSNLTARWTLNSQNVPIEAIATHCDGSTTSPYTITLDKPEVNFTEPNTQGENGNNGFNIRWTDTNPDGTAKISLYYDTNNSGYNGTLIASNISANSSDSYFWDTSSLPYGTYYVYAIVNDTASTTQRYSSGSITRANTAPSIVIVEPNTLLEQAAGSFQIRWADTDPDSSATISLYYDTDKVGYNGTLIVADIAEDPDGLADRYTWNTSNVPAGTYYVYGEISDGQNTDRHYSIGSVQVLKPDLVANHLEVTQGIQDLNNSVRLVEKKRTFVRFHVNASFGAYNTTANLIVSGQGAPVTLEPIGGNATIDVVNNPDRMSLDQAFLFEIPSAYLNEGSLTLTGVLNPNAQPQETNSNNNQISKTVSFEPGVDPIFAGDGVHLGIFRVLYRIAGTEYLSSSNEIQYLSRWLKNAYPINNLNIVLNSTLDLQQFDVINNNDPNCSSSGTFANCMCSYVNAKMGQTNPWDLPNVPQLSRMLGIVTDAGITMSPSCAGDIPGLVASAAAGPNPSAYGNWDTDESYVDWLGGHELGHLWGRRHTRCNGNEQDTDPNYPHPNGRISPTLSGTDAIYGFNVETLEILPPSSSDVMTYCENKWVSDYTYHGLLDYFQDRPTLQTPIQPSPTMDRLPVYGFIAQDKFGNLNTTVFPMFTVPNAPETELRVAGPYDIVLKNGNKELARYPFSAELDEETGKLHFSEMVPSISGTNTVVIEKDGNVLFSKTSGASTPVVSQVNATVRSGGIFQNFGSRFVDLNWQGLDSDGDPLLYNVQYSYDNGNTWQTVAMDVTDSSISINSKNLPASDPALLRGMPTPPTGNGLFRVWANDGIHTSLAALSAGVYIGNHSPQVTLTNTNTPATITTKQTLALEVWVNDLDSGDFKSNQIKWLSNRDGLLGTAEQLSVSGLSIGNHTITVEVSDALNNVSRRSLNINVVSGLNQL